MMISTQILQMQMSVLIALESVVMAHVGIELEDLNVCVVQDFSLGQTTPVKV
jgi:hypothetical protein